MPLSCNCFYGNLSAGGNLNIRNIPLNLKMNHAVTEVYEEATKTYLEPILTGENPGKSIHAAMFKSRLAILQKEKGQLHLALKYVTESISMYPDNHPDLCSVYAFRADVLDELKQFVFALTDTNRSLQIVCKDFQMRLDLRYKRSKYVLKLQTMLHEHYERVVSNILEDAYMISNLRQERLQEFLYKENTIENQIKVDRHATFANFDVIFPLPKVSSKNPILPNASEKIRVQQSETIGRYIVATDVIDAGEVLLIDKPYVNSISLRYRLTHCSNCLLRNPALIPCKNCSVVMYCGDPCRDEAFRRYHKSECPILILMSKQGVDFDYATLLILRVFLVATDQGTSLRALFENPVYGNPCCAVKSFDVDQPYFSDDYINIHNLEDKYEKRSNREWSQFARNAAHLLYYLKKSSFFVELQNSENKPDLTVLERFAGALLLKYSFSVQINAHEISELVCIRDDVKKNSIGAGLFSVLRLANHSCDQNTSVTFHKNCAVVRARRPIAIGEEITDNYGANYICMKARVREKFLNRYYFKCKCKPCKYQWPLLEQLSRENPTYLVNDPDIELLAKMKSTFVVRPQGCSDHYLDFLCTYSALLHLTIEKPWYDHCTCDLQIYKVLESRGNCYDNIKDIILEHYIKLHL